MLKVPPNICRKTSNFNQYEHFLKTCYAKCDCVVSSPSIGLIFIVHLKIISALKTGSFSKMKVVSVNADTILVAINKRSNTNINEVN